MEVSASIAPVCNSACWQRWMASAMFGYFLMSWIVITDLQYHMSSMCGFPITFRFASGMRLS